MTLTFANIGISKKLVCICKWIVEALTMPVFFCFTFDFTRKIIKAEVWDVTMSVLRWCANGGCKRKRVQVRPYVRAWKRQQPNDVKDIFSRSQQVDICVYVVNIYILNTHNLILTIWSDIPKWKTARKTIWWTKKKKKRFCTDQTYQRGCTTNSYLELFYGWVATTGNITPPHLFSLSLRINAASWCEVFDSVVEPWGKGTYVFHWDFAFFHVIKWLTEAFHYHDTPTKMMLPCSPDLYLLDY